MNHQPPPIQPVSVRIRESTTFKVFMIGFLVLILLIPAGMIRSLVRERERRQGQVANEIGAKWGRGKACPARCFRSPIRMNCPAPAERR